MVGQCANRLVRVTVGKGRSFKGSPFVVSGDECRTRLDETVANEGPDGSSRVGVRHLQEVERNAADRLNVAMMVTSRNKHG